MKKFYSLVISVIDKHGNRVEAHEITGSNDREQILIEREQLDKEVKSGKYDSWNIKNCTLKAEIEVHNDEIWELLYIM